MKLIKMSVSTDEESGAKFRMKEMEMKETANSYIGEGFRISKNNLMKIDTTMYNTGATLYFYTYCLPDLFENACKLLLQAIKDRYAVLKTQHDTLTKSIEVINKSALSDYLMNVKRLA